MTAVSSPRPHLDCPEEIEMNQIRAKESWNKVFQSIIYLGCPIPGFQEKTSFIPHTGKPTIKRLAEVCAQQYGWSCIINSDIVMAPQTRHLESNLEAFGGLCAVSRRYEIPPSGNIEDAILLPDDYGLDFFCAKQEVWQFVATVIPEQFKIGMIVWDQWMSNCFVREFQPYCYDLTPSRLVFHPRHANRNYEHFEPPKDFYLQWSLWPNRELVI